MKLSTTVIKTLVVSMILAFAGQALAAPTDWFNVTAVGNDLVLSSGVTTNGITEGVEVANSVLSIDLPASEVFQITPEGEKPAGATEGKTYIDVDGAEFTPTYTNDIDNTVLDGAQTALTVAYDDTPTTNYYAYIGGDWIKLTGATPTSSSVNVRVELDYSNIAVTNAAFKIGDVYLRSAADGVTWQFPISGSQRALGRVDLAGYGKIHSITSTVEAAVNVTIEPTSVTYGADFTNVTIVATVSGDGYDQATYTLDWNGNTVQATPTLVGNTLTITAPIDAPSTGTSRASATYTISVVNGQGSSGEKTTMIADSSAWVTEDVDNQHTTGSWSAGNVEYVDSVATVADNTYTASSCSTGDLVTITFENLRYTEFSDLSVETPAGTQGAFALAETNINAQASTNFCVLAKEGEDYIWVAADCSIAATTNVDYTVVMTFDYVGKKYSVKVSDGTNEGNLTVGGQPQFDLCVTKAAVTDFVFKGSGTMSGIKGVDSTCFMAKDGLGNWYTTIAAALATDGKEFIILRDTGVEAPSGWKFVEEGGITKLIKAAKGVFFMVY